MANLTMCISCNECQKCNSCQGCNDCQSFCENGRQNSNNGFNFGGACVATGERVFSLSTWNSAITQINEVFDRGSEQDASSSKINTYSGEYLTANEFNRVASTVSYSTRVNSGDEMKGTYFSGLRNAVANLKYKWGQCDICNANCDQCVTCDGGCNAGAQKIEREFCCSCDTGETEETE